MTRKTLISAIAVLFLGLVSLSPAHADGIEVLEQRQQADFPQGLTLTITTESGAEIVDIRLNYRTAGDGIWAYTYPTFTPGPRVTASFTLPTDGADYLPPGARIEFFYTIRDGAGAVYQTSNQVLEHQDPRFSWEETQIGPLALRYHSIARSRVEALSDAVGPDLRRITDLLQLEQASPIKGTIYNSQSEARPAFPLQSRTTTELEVFQGFAFPSHGVFVAVHMEPSIIVHESAHLLMGQALADSPAGIPAWLDEGFASYVEPGSRPYSGRTLSGQGLPLRSMAAVSGNPHAIQTFYLKSESVVAYLIEEHGDRAFQRFIAQLALSGLDIDGAMQSVYGFDIEGLESRWATSNMGQPAPPLGGGVRSLPSPLVYLDTWLFGGLVLLAVVVIAGRFLWRKLYPRPDAEDGLQPWEDPDLR